MPKDKVKVVVKSGEVPLTDEVEWWHQRERAEKLMRDLLGVKSVNNQIAIKPTIVPQQIREKSSKNLNVMRKLMPKASKLKRQTAQ